MGFAMVRVQLLFSAIGLLYWKPCRTEESTKSSAVGTNAYLVGWTSLSQEANPLGSMGREPACQTSKSGSNPIWDATVHPGCETFNVMRAFKNHYIKCTANGPINKDDAAEVTQRTLTERGVYKQQPGQRSRCHKTLR